MSRRNLHQALKTERLQSIATRSTRFDLVKLWWGKEDVGFSLHAEPRTYTTSGSQITDFLRRIGFYRNECAFIDRGECYVLAVGEHFNLDGLIADFDRAYDELLQAEHQLESCGYYFDQPEAWGYFHGKPSGRSIRPAFSTSSGDGHTAAHSELMKSGEDERFSFRFSWVKSSEYDKGWTIHCNPKHPPLSSEMRSVFVYLGIVRFDQCPYFDFEECHWRHIPHESRPGEFYDDNAHTAHGWFDSHQGNFSEGIRHLLTANGLVERFDLKLLPGQERVARAEEDMKQRSHFSKPSVKVEGKFEYDVALSFAGREREHAEALAQILEREGFSVFYDEFYPEQLWGKDLFTFFDEVYRKKSRYCVIFVSREYNEREWTIHERRSAQARALKEKGEEYILPIKVEDVELDGLAPTVGYVTLTKGLEHIGHLLLKKLRPTERMRRK